MERARPLCAAGSARDVVLTASQPSITSVETARRLKAAGLEWTPTLHDFFTIPWSGLEERVFVINELATELMSEIDPPIISFNGAVEWSLDYVVSAESVWLPTEAQLRELLGESFIELASTEGGFVCSIRQDGDVIDLEAPSAPEAYARALLEVLST